MKEGYEEQSALIEQHNLRKHSLQQRSETLQEQLDRNKRLLQEENQRLEELTALHSVSNDLESKKTTTFASEVSGGRQLEIKIKWFCRKWKTKISWFARKGKNTSTTKTVFCDCLIDPHRSRFQINLY